MRVHENDVPSMRHPWRYDFEPPRSPHLDTQVQALPIGAQLLRTRASWPRPVRKVARSSERDATLPVPGSPRLAFCPGRTLGHCALHFPDRDRLELEQGRQRRAADRPAAELDARDLLGEPPGRATLATSARTPAAATPQRAPVVADLGREPGEEEAELLALVLARSATDALDHGRRSREVVVEVDG